MVPLPDASEILYRTRANSMHFRPNACPWPSLTHSGSGGHWGCFVLTSKGSGSVLAVAERVWRLALYCMPAASSASACCCVTPSVDPLAPPSASTALRDAAGANPSTRYVSTSSRRIDPTVVARNASIQEA
jgi:hypothetical protein